MPLPVRRSPVLLLALAAGLAQPLAARHPGHEPVAAAAASGGAALPSGVEIPAGARRCVEAFLAMLNDPTPARVEAFENEFGSAERRTRMANADRAKMLAAAREQRGEVAFVKALSAGPGAVAITVSATRDEALNLEFQFSESEAGKLDGVMISPAREALVSQAIDGATRAAIVEGSCRALEEKYVFPEVAAKMAALARENLKKGEYDALADEASLSRRLTKDFRSISNDKHLGVRLEPKREGRRDGPSAEEIAGENYAFRKAEVLHGGIGYLKFDAFVESREAEATAAAALGFLANSRALVVDLRENGGGSPEMIRYITTSLFSRKTHLNDMVDREGKVVEEFWTYETSEGGPATKFADDLPVFVLTSGRTFSGAEEFAYNLKNLKRATIVGETTGGGAHPVMGERLTDRVVIGVPFMRAQNPISKTNWEGTGVAPDVSVPASEALDKALGMAKEAIAAKDKPKK